jgi:hypothetical protein
MPLASNLRRGTVSVVHPLVLAFLASLLCFCGLGWWLVAVVPPDPPHIPGVLLVARVGLVDGDPLVLHFFLLWGALQLLALLLVVVSLFPILWIAPRLANGIRMLARRADSVPIGPATPPGRPVADPVDPPPRAMIELS